MKERIEFKNVRSFGEIIGDTFLFIKQNFKPLFKSFFTLCGVFILAGMIIAIYTQLEIKQLTQSFDNGVYSQQVTRWNMLFTWRFLFIFLFSILNSSVMYVTVLSYIALYIRKEKVAPTVEEVWSYFKFYFFRVFLSGFAVVPFVMLGFICCILPGIYVFPAMLLFFPVMILENAGFSYAFSRVFTILKQEWWITAATILVIFIITTVCMSIIQLPSLIFMMIASFSQIGKPINDAYYMAVAIFQHITQIFFVIPIVCSALIYSNLVERKESVGLMERMDRFGTGHKEVYHSEEEEY